MSDTRDLGTLPPGPLTAAFKAEIERSLATAVPPGKRGALLVVVDKDGAQVEVTANLTDDGDWRLGAEASTTWGGNVSGRVMLTGSW